MMKCLIWRHVFYIPEIDPNKVKEIFNNLLRKAKFGVVEFVEKPLRDRGYGSYTAEWVLEESHFIFRVFPRERITYCEISSCNAEKFCTFVKLVEPMSVSTEKLMIWSHQMTISQTKQERLKGNIEKLIQRARLNVSEFVEHHFPGTGFTAGWILEHGHINIHTFPEDEKSDLELTLFHRQGFTLITGLFFDQLYI